MTLRLPVLLGLLSLGGPAFATTGSVMSDLSDPELRARYEKDAAERIRCEELPDFDARLAAYEAADDHKWDRPGMGCATLYGFQVVEETALPTSLIGALLSGRVKNIERHLLVLGAHLEYFDVLTRSYSDHYQGVEISSELALRWAQTKERAAAIVEKVEPLEDKLPEVRIVRAAFHLASTQREADIQAQNAAIRLAMEDLEVAVAKKPKALDGLGPHLLGQLLITLPEFLGGDALRGLELLEKAHALNPTDLSIHRLLIEGYLGERENDKALAILEDALSVDPAAENPQDYVDDTKFLGGLAVRLGREDLVGSFRDKRQAVLDAQPGLLTRKQTAAFGHGGENPITGEHADELN